jgi:hypothetical protein
VLLWPREYQVELPDVVGLNLRVPIVRVNGGIVGGAVIAGDGGFLGFVLDVV